MRRLLKLIVGATSLALVGATAALAAELVHLDASGIIRWTADDREVALFGANYSLASSCDYRAAGLVGADRKQLVEQDLAHFARMGWDGLRLCLWGDWENSDAAGNLLVNDHLDVMDYAIFQAKQRGIYILLTPITTYAAWWPDGKAADSYPGFSAHFKRSQLGTDPAAIAVQQNYLRQLLHHVNPYTGVALKDEPQILFVEMINEPWHHAEDPAGSVAYINALVDAVRSTGCTKLLFHNLTQDTRMAPMIAASKVQGFTFAWYPTGLLAQRTLGENYLRWADDFSPLLGPGMPTMPRIVYEFDSADMTAAYMYPAMVRAFRGAGAQFAAMFSYDMLATAPYNLGWQTHFLNLVYTPRKAVSAIIAAEAMRVLPRGATYGAYPANRRFGPCRVSYEDDASELITAEAYFSAGDTTTPAPSPATLRRIVGCGSSPLVNYEGNGSYFLDRLADGLWRLEVYPDAVVVQDPFAQKTNATTVSARLLWHTWPMTLQLPDLGESFTAAPLNAGNTHHATAQNRQVAIRPGVYLLSRRPDVDRTSLPPRLGQIALDEFVCPPATDLPLQILSHARTTQPTDQPLTIDFELLAAIPPDSAALHVTSTQAATPPRDFPLTRTHGYTWRATLPAGTFAPGEVALTVSTTTGARTKAFATTGHPHWTIALVAPTAPLRLFDASHDATQVFAMRVSGDHAADYVKPQPATADQPAVLLLRAPGAAALLPALHAVSLPIKARIGDRLAALASTRSVQVTLRGSARELRVSLVEADGATWSVLVPVAANWKTVTVPLAAFRLGPGVKLPLGYPGNWNYPLPSPLGRGGVDDGVQLARVEHLQFVLPPALDQPAAPTAEIARVELRFVD